MSRQKSGFTGKNRKFSEYFYKSAPASPAGIPLFSRQSSFSSQSSSQTCLSAACPAPSARIASCRIISWQKIFCGSCGCAFCSGPSQFREGLCRRKRSCRMFSLSRQTVVSWSAPHNSSASRATPSNPPASMRGVGRSLWTPPRASSSRAVRRSCSS